MHVFPSFDALPADFPPRPVALTIGVFDGVHRGHRALIGRVVEVARAAGALAGLVTFARHPLALLAPPYEPPRLATAARRRAIFASLGLDVVLEIEFTREFAHIEAEDFVRRLLVGRMRMAAIVCGGDHRFGYKGRGDRALLAAMAPELGYAVHHVAPVRAHNMDLSSTSVRDWLYEGRVDQVREALARPYELVGEVVAGDKRGRTIGFPTANVAPVERLLVPGRGVYACWAEEGTSDHREHREHRAGTEEAEKGMAMVNVGTRPTFDGTREVVEAHLLNFDGDLYGRTIALHFMARLRDERPFAGIDALRAQLAADAAATRAALAADPLDKADN